MPMRTLPSASPGTRTHSCSTVYLRSSGYIGRTPPSTGSQTTSRETVANIGALALLGCAVSRDSSARLLGRGRREYRVDGHVPALLDRAGGTLIAQARKHAARNGQCRGKRRGIADHLD